METINIQEGEILTHSVTPISKHSNMVVYIEPTFSDCEFSVVATDDDGFWEECILQKDSVLEAYVAAVECADKLAKRAVRELSILPDKTVGVFYYKNGRVLLGNNSGNIEDYGMLDSVEVVDSALRPFLIQKRFLTKKPL